MFKRRTSSFLILISKASKCLSDICWNTVNQNEIKEKSKFETVPKLKKFIILLISLIWYSIDKLFAPDSKLINNNLNLSSGENSDLRQD